MHTDALALLANGHTAANLLADKITADKEIVAPTSYALLWPISAGAVLLLIAGWYVFMFWFTRRRAEKLAAKEKQARKLTLRQKYLEDIEEIGNKYSKGELNLRQTHAQLNKCLREFATRVSGTDVTVKSLEEIRKQPDVAKLADVVQSLYEPEFAEESDAESLVSVQRAKEAVASW